MPIKLVSILSEGLCLPFDYDQSSTFVKSFYVCQRHIIIKLRDQSVSLEKLTSAHLVLHHLIL